MGCFTTACIIFVLPADSAGNEKFEFKFAANNALMFFLFPKLIHNVDVSCFPSDYGVTTI